VTKLLREPLVLFLLIGALLFGVSALVGTGPMPESDRRIIVNSGRIQNLKISFRRAEGHDPTPAETQGLIDDYVREEVLCREARALGLDRDDTIVRSVLRQRMEYLALGAGPKRTAKDPAGRAAEKKAVLDAAYQQQLAHYQVMVEKSSAGGLAP
jgi:hypothetical protein